MKNSNFPRSNREIRAAQVRLVGEDGEMIGVVSLREALDLAEKVSLDLVEISPNAEPPVCKILDFGKFKYEAKKRAAEAKKKQKVTLLKEIKYKLNIGDGDFEVKLKKIKQFLLDGDKIKVSLWFKGRGIVHNDIGMKLFEKILEKLGDSVKVESAPKLEGKQIIMVLASPIQQLAK